jgi:hypothetical protein
MTGLEKFLGHLRRKIRVLGTLSGAFVAVGVASLVESSTHKTLAPLCGASFIMAAVSAYVTYDGLLTSRKVERLSHNESRCYVLATRPVDHTGTATRVSSGILATLTEMGSDGRPTVAEMRSRWFTPGMSDQPTSTATLFGSLEIGSAVLAVADRGGILGTVTAVRTAITPVTIYPGE